MGCVDGLCRDHDRIAEAAQVATGLAVTLIQDRDIPSADLDELVEYARSFVQGVHQRREEEVLFPVVKSRLPQLASECDRLRADHARMRSLIDIASSSAEERSRRGEALAEWSRLVRAHDREEEAYLMPLVERALRPDVCSTVISGFASLGAGGGGSVEALLGRWPVPV